MPDEPKEGEKPEQSKAPETGEEVFDKERAMALIAKLRGEVKELSGKAKKADELEQAETKRKESEMSELEKLQKRLTETETRLKQKEIAEARRAAAEKVGLPVALAQRLQGETPEELETDAKALLESLPKADAPKNPKLSPTNPGGAQQGETMEQQLARIHGQSANPFDARFAQSKGGGVLAPQEHA